MSFFDLDPTATQNVMDQARLNPLDPETLKPGWFAGAWKSPVTGLASTINDAALLLGDAGTPLLRGAARPIDELFGTTTATDWVNRQQQAAVSNIKEWAPDPRTTGVVGQVVHGLFNIIPEVLAGGPEVAGVLQGYKGFRGGMADGLDPGTALGKGAIDGISTWAGLKLPISIAPHTGLVGTVGTGIGGNVLTGMASRGATEALLTSRGFPEMAAQYKVLDSEAIAVDLLLGGAFGAAAHYGPKAFQKYQEIQVERGIKALPSDIDTALGMNNQLHVELDTAPGIPTDPAARAAHVEAIDAAISSLLKGEDVQVGDAVTRAEFTENPSAAATRTEIVRVVQDHMGPEWQGLQGELEARGLPTDTTLYRISGPIEPLPFARQPIADGIHEVASAETINRAEKSGRISTEEATLAKWLLENNPAIGRDLGLLFRQNAGDQVGGEYSPTRRLATIFSGGGDPLTTTHEILHHTERMMPQDVRDGIRAAWSDEVGRLERIAAETGDTEMGRALSDVRKATIDQGTDSQLKDAKTAHDNVVNMVKQGLVGSEFYALVNPSEFWAVNASKLVRERAQEGWVAKATQWIKELIAKAMDAFGLRSDAAVIRGLDAVLKANGEITGNVLSEGAPLKNVEAPGQDVAAKNFNGFEPALRVRVDTTGLELPAKPLILTGSSTKNAARQISHIDDILAKFPDAATSPLEWSRMMAYAFGTDDVVIPPYRFITDMNSSGAVDTVKSLSKGQLADADHGFSNAREYFELYTTGQMDVTDTGKLLLWSFLSKGVSPYVQESMFIDAFKGIDPFIKLAGEGKFTKETLTDFYAWAETVASKGEGKPGAGTSHNLNGFGRDFLLKMNQPGEDGRTHLQRLHDLMADPTKSGKDIRREFHTFAEGVGIDNKVLSFTLLVTGRTDVMVLDRVQFRHLWDDGRFEGRNLYDGRKEAGSKVAGTSLSDLGDGVRGLFVYEAIEAALQKRIENIYTAAGRPQDASVGRYHWESWVADSAQEASHGSIDAVMRAVKGETNPLSGVTAKEGQYDTRQYGARYGLDDNGVPTFRYPDSTGKEYNFDLASFRAMLAEMQKSASGVEGKNFKITDKRYENQPWFTRPDVNRDALDVLVRKYGRSGEEGAPDGRSDQAALPDGAGPAGADPYGAEAIIANNPALTIIGADGTMVSAGRALVGADAEIASSKRDSQGYDAAVACALRG